MGHFWLQCSPSKRIGPLDPLSDLASARPLADGEVAPEVVPDLDFPEMPQEVTDPSRWHLLWAAPLVFRNPFMLKRVGVWSPPFGTSVEIMGVLIPACEF